MIMEYLLPKDLTALPVVYKTFKGHTELQLQKYQSNSRNNPLHYEMPGMNVFSSVTRNHK